MSDFGLATVGGTENNNGLCGLAHWEGVWLDRGGKMKVSSGGARNQHGTLNNTYQISGRTDERHGTRPLSCFTQYEARADVGLSLFGEARFCVR